jgi:hypothetical protein
MSTREVGREPPLAAASGGEVLFHPAEVACIGIGAGGEPGSREVSFIT